MKKILSIYFSWWHFKWSVPKYDITIKHTEEIETRYLKTLSSEGVRIVREAPHGIPHIFGKTKYDCYFGQGFAQAQERLAQLDTLRRVASGRMSELDPMFLFIDRMIMTIGTNDEAIVNKFLENMDEDDHRMLTSYVNGINYFIKSKYYKKPVHLYETKNPDVEEFTAKDITLILLFVCWQMNMGGWMIKIINATLQNVVDQMDLESFQIGAAREHKHCAAFYNDMDWKEVEKFLDMKNPGGSNCVCIGGKFTKSGGAHLYSDTHLAVLNPSFWFQNRLKCDEFDATGFTPSGFFGLTVFHNNHISCGVTLSFADLYELYFEEVDPDDPNKYVHHLDPKNGEKVWKKFAEKKVENVKVNGYADTSYIVRSSDRGPIISDVWDNVKMRDFEKTLMKKKGWFSVSGSKNADPSKAAEFLKPENDDEKYFQIKGKEYEGKKYVLAFKSVFTEYHEGVSILRMLDVAGCKNFQEFKGKLEQTVVVTLNMCFADKDGNIGYYMTGRVPKRTKEAQALNNMPLPGWLPEKYSWQGYYDEKKNPQAFNPKCGYIVSCNQEMISQSDYYKDGEEPMFLGRVYLPSARARQMTTQLFRKFKEIEDSVGDEHEGESDEEEKEKKKKTEDAKIDTEFGKFLQGDYHLHEDSDFFIKMLGSFFERRKDVENKRMKEWIKMNPLVGELNPVDINPELVYGAAEKIANWDFNTDVKSVGCTLYSLLEMELLHSVLVDGNDFFKYDENNKKDLIFTKALVGHGIDREYWPFNEYWEKSQNVVELLLQEKCLQNKNTLAYRSCLVNQQEEEVEGEEEEEEKKKKDDIVDLDFLVWKTLVRMVRRLRKMRKNVAKPNAEWKMELEEEYQWGKFHQITWAHNLKDFTNEFDIGPFPVGGTSKVPCAFATSVDMNDFKVIDLPSMRFVVDMGNPKETAEGILPPGISENPCSKHYQDTAVPYLNHEYFKMRLIDYKDFVGRKLARGASISHEGIISISKKFQKKEKKSKKKEEEVLE